jgi:hypothetical protein
MSEPWAERPPRAESERSGARLARRLRRHALDPELRAQHEAVSKRRYRDGLHVVWNDEVTSGEGSLAASQLE